MLRLPLVHRERFREPFGDLYPELHAALPRLSGKAVYTVGDVVTRNILMQGLFPAIAIIDGQTKRVPCGHTPLLNARKIYVKNPAGMVTDELVRAIADAVAAPPAVIMVDGEEDLAVIPLVLAAPGGAVVLYGQPCEGVVIRDIDLAAKKTAAEMLSLFERI
jgi:uncharacterized protein (UPF0218 family)